MESITESARGTYSVYFRISPLINESMKQLENYALCTIVWSGFKRPTVPMNDICLQVIVCKSTKLNIDVPLEIHI